MIANSAFAFGLSAAIHVTLIVAVVVTVGTFKAAESNPHSFDFIKGKKK